MKRSRPDHIDVVDFQEVPQFPDFTDIEHGQLFALSLSNNTTGFTHGLHRFAAKYIPLVPAWALDNFADRTSVILDPFMGSATTLVEGIVRGGTNIGIDIDPLARLIARAKVTAIDEERLHELAEELAATWTTPAATLAVPMPDIRNFEHWFSTVQWGWVQALRDAILALDCNDDERRFLLVVFSSTLRWVSNADDQSQKTYVSGTLSKKPPAVREVFWRFLNRAIEGLSDLNRKRHSEAVVHIPDQADATALNLPPESVDVAITSPPYLDSVDYPYNMMLEYFWLGQLIGIPDRKSFNALRRSPIGAKNPAERILLPPELDGIIRTDVMPPTRRIAAAAYFSLMRRHFHEASAVLKPGARYVFVVGNSQSLVDVLPLHQSFVHLAQTSGLELERAFGYRIRRHYMKFPRNGRGGIILIDWVLVFRKRESRKEAPSLPLPWLTLAPNAVAH
jgi:hypothetical protein